MDKLKSFIKLTQRIVFLIVNHFDGHDKILFSHRICEVKTAPALNSLPLQHTNVNRFVFSDGSACVKDCGDLHSVSSLFLPRPQEPVVRLVNKEGSRGQGRVEVLYEGVWGTVCDDGWDINDASVVCKELGFGKAKEASKHSSFGKGKSVFHFEKPDLDFGIKTAFFMISSTKESELSGWIT